ncbi:C5a anaphylatoxin chemotactic receptor 1-like isoform X3 [Gigantopelta aegis]|nr:C5a anaphylatoxin chemotactic receptor 1-like isoform X3 [Gigantopelta aegis]
MDINNSMNFTTAGYDVNSTADEHSESFVPNLFKWNGAEMIFLIILFVAGIVGNTLVIYVYHVKWRRSNFTLFIEVLAAIDLTNCLVSLSLFFVLTLYKGDKFGPVCSTASYVAIGTALSSGFVLVIVAFDRNWKIHNPIKHELTIGMTWKMCLAAVVVGMAASIPGTFMFGRKETVYVDDGGVAFNHTWCFFKAHAFKSYTMYIFASVLGVVFLFILTSLSVLYFLIWRALRVHLQRRASLGCSRIRVSLGGKDSHGNYYRAQKTTARLFFIITIAFFLTYFPYFIALYILIFKDTDPEFLSPVGKAFVDLAKLSPMMSNVINPIIYSLSSTRFRREIVMIFKGVSRSSPGKKKNVVDQPVRLNFKHSHSASSLGGSKAISNDHINIVFAKIPITDRQTLS